MLHNLWCSLTHRRHWFWYGHGDYRIQQCGKCGDVWPVPFQHVKGERRDPHGKAGEPA